MLLRAFQVAVLAIAVTAVNAAEHEAVAAVLVAEAGGEGVNGMLAVMEVIQNRARQDHRTRFNTVVARQQFSALNQTTIRQLIANARQHKQWNMAMKISIHGTSTNLTHGADHYHEIGVKPYWAESGRVTARIKRHVFYRLE